MNCMKSDEWMAGAAQDHKKICDIFESLKNAEILNWLPKTYQGTPARMLEDICNAVNDMVRSQHALSAYYRRETNALGRIYNRIHSWMSKEEMPDRKLHAELILRAGTVKGRSEQLCAQQENSLKALEKELETCRRERAKIESYKSHAAPRVRDPELFQDCDWKQDLAVCSRNDSLTNLATRIEALRLAMTSIRASHETCNALYDKARTIACMDSYAHAAINACAQVPPEYCLHFEQLAKEAANLARKLQYDITMPSTTSPVPALKLASQTAVLQESILKAAMP